jgi:hypothetical protein
LGLDKRIREVGFRSSKYWEEGIGNKYGARALLDISMLEKIHVVFVLTIH